MRRRQFRDQEYSITAATLDAQTLDTCAVALQSAQIASIVDLIAKADAPAGATPAPAATGNAALIKAARRASKTVAIRHDSAPPAPGAPSVLTTRFGAPTVSNDSWSLTDAPHTPVGDELANRVRAVGNAYSRISLAHQQCFVQIMGGNLGAMSQSLHEKYDEALVNPQVARAHSRKLIAELRTSEAQEAALTGILAAYEGAIAGQVDPGAVNKLAIALRDALGQPAVVSDADVAATWTLAKDKADALDAESKSWGLSESERLSLLGLQRSAYRAHEGGGYGGEQRSRVPLAEAGEAGSFGAGAQAGVASALGKALRGLLTGNVAAVVAGAAELLPQDNPFVIALKGSAALASGDFVTAMKQASLLAPKDSALAVALALPDTAAGIARSAGVR